MLYVSEYVVMDALRLHSLVGREITNTLSWDRTYKYHERALLCFEFRNKQSWPLIVTRERLGSVLGLGTRNVMLFTLNCRQSSPALTCKCMLYIFVVFPKDHFSVSL